MAYTPENNPYIPGDPYSYDLKWVVSNIKDLIANYTGQMNELKAYIMDYINSLDLSPIVAAELQKMYDNGEFDALIASFITDNKVLLVDTDQSAVFTEAEKETGRKNLRAGRSNTNLFKNAWFSINQQELTSGTSGYAADMWNTTFGSGGMSWYRNPDGSITLYPTASSYAALVQKFEADFISFMTGKTVTLSALLGNGDIVSVTTIFQAITLNAAQNVQFSISPSLQTVQVRTIIMNVGQTIRAVKLELGTVSTLENDAPSDYAEELAKCQRHFIRLKGDTSGVTVGVGYAVSTTSTRILIPTPTTMAKVPTLTFANSSGIFLVGNGQKVSPSNIGLPALAEIQKNGVSINAYYNGLTANQVYALIIEDPTSYIDLNAEP